MVLHDIVNEYCTVITRLDGCRSFFEKGNDMILQYLSDMYTISSNLHDNSEMNTEDLTTLSITSEKAFLSSIIELYSMSFSILYTLEESNSLNISMEPKIRLSSLKDCVNKFIVISNNIIESKVLNIIPKHTFPEIIEIFLKMREEYQYLYNSHLSLSKIEIQLMEPLPEKMKINNLKNFELRSLKTNYDLLSYAQDINLLAKFIAQAQNVFKSSTPLYLRKIESGSLKITWSGKEVEISCISDVINAIIKGIKSLAFLPSEIKIKQQEINKLELENEALAIENKSKKLAIVSSQIDIISEKLGLDKNNPEDVEKIQQLCIPLIGYLENNPVGCINDQKYDIDSSIKYLILKEE